MTAALLPSQRERRKRNQLHLSKAGSLQELRLSGQKLRYQRRKAILTLCTCASEEAEHELESHIPRARRSSAPAQVYQLDLTHDLIPSSDESVAHGKKSKRGFLADALSSVARSMVLPVATSDRDKKSHDDFERDGLDGDIMDQSRLVENNVATATYSTHPCSASLCVVGQENSQQPLLGSESSLPSEEPELSHGVDRPKAQVVMAPRHKSSGHVLFIDVQDFKSENNELIILNQDDASTPAHQRQLRTLRRKKHLNVLQTSSSGKAAPEPIAISLTIRSSTSKTDLKPISEVANARTHSQPISISTDSTESSKTPCISPITLTISPTSEVMVSASPTSSSPVRLGHPSRPYYSAIRKNGISTSPSRPTSIVGPSGSPTSSRPQSYTPSPTNATMTTAASRRLSMSTMFYSPAYSLPSENVFSVFSLPDDEEESDAGDNDMPQLPPTPAPGAGRFSFSLPRKTKETTHRLSYDNNYDGVASQLPSQSRAKGYRGSGVGFSMSGQTELRMALAAGAASAGVAESGFRFYETTAPLVALNQDDGENPRSGDEYDRRAKGGMDPASARSFAERVKKLRKGLKDMLLMTSTTS